MLHLDAAAPGHAEELFAWAEAEAVARDIPLVRVQIPHGHALAGLAAGRGYAQWRRSLTMEVALDDPPRPALPPGIELRPYREQDAEPLRVALNEAFAGDPLWHEISPANFREFYLGERGFDPALWLLARHGEELAGFVLAYPLHGSDTGLGWVGHLGVVPRRRGSGLGEALLRSAFHELHARGLRRAGLGVDAANPTGAVRLYERVGMRCVRRSDSWQLRL